MTDEEFLADEQYIFDRYAPATIGTWSTRIFDDGEGAPILFVPIIRGLEVVYAKQLRAFAGTNRVVLYERTESVDKPVYVAARVAEMRALLDHLEIERAHVVGLGDAGVPTFNFGREHPDRCISLTSICLGPRYRVPPYWLNERILNPLVEHLPMERVIPDKMIRAMVVKATAGGGPLPPHLIGHMVDHIPDQMRVHKYSVLPVTGRHEMRDWARDLRMPTLLINRDDDPLAPVAEMEELAGLLPNCHGLTVLEDGGRFITYTHADEINGLLRDFFRVAARRPGTGRGPASGEPVTSAARSGRGDQSPSESDKRAARVRRSMERGSGAPRFGSAAGRRFRDRDLRPRGGRGGPLRPHPRARRGHLRSAAARLRPRPPRHHLPAP